MLSFQHTNPEWQPPEPSNAFLSHLKQRVQTDANAMSIAQNPYDNPLATSLHSLSSVGYGVSLIKCFASFQCKIRTEI